MAQLPTERLKIFYSYSHKDQAYHDQLESHLANLRRRYQLQTWFDRQIQAGENWETVLEEKLNTADLIFLLISPDFMNSEYCYNKEMTRALERHARGEAKVIPILVRHVHWAGAPFSHLQVLPTGARPISVWMNPDDGYGDIVVTVEKIIQDLLISRQKNAPTESLHIFYCYAREDKILRDYLEMHLEPFKRLFQFTSWHDQEIKAGEEWEKEIETNLEKAQLILLLISPSFMASDYCYTKEMEKALKRHKQGKARVIPILLRDVDWEDAPFCQLQILPTNAIPVTMWQDHDAAFADIARNIRQSIKEFLITKT